MIRKGGIRPFEWWAEVAEGDRISVDCHDGARHFTAFAPFAGALGVWVPPGPKDWSPALRERGLEFHAVGDVLLGERVYYRIRRADVPGKLSPLVKWDAVTPLLSTVVGVLRAGSTVMFPGNIRASI